MYGSVQTQSEQANGTPRSFNVTVGAGTDRALVVWIRTNNSVTLSNVQYAGNAMSQVGTTVCGNGATDWCSHAYIITGPAAGTAAVTFNVSAWTRTVIHAATYSGVDQASPVGNISQGNAAASNPPTLTMSHTRSSANSLVVQSIWTTNDYSQNYPANTTNNGTTRYFDSRTMNSNNKQFGLSDWTPMTTGTTSITQTFTGASHTPRSAGYIFELMPSGPPPTPTPTVTPTATLTPTPNFTLIKSSSHTVASVGDTVTFCIDWNNPSSSPMTRVFLDNLQPEYTFINADSGCTASGQLVTCSFPAAAYSSGTKCIRVEVNSVP